MFGNLVKDLPMKEAVPGFKLAAKDRKAFMNWIFVEGVSTIYNIVCVYIYIIYSYVIVYVYIILRMPCICIYTLCVSPFQQQWKVRVFFGIPLVNK